MLASSFWSTVKAWGTLYTVVSGVYTSEGGQRTEFAVYGLVLSGDEVFADSAMPSERSIMDSFRNDIIPLATTNHVPSPCAGLSASPPGRADP
jgi:hypothetical protein